VPRLGRVKAPPPEHVDVKVRGVVNLIDGEWEPYDPAEEEPEPEAREEEMEPIEGCTLENVGWTGVG
jgi:hypothetical protein